MLADLRITLEIPTQTCVLAHVTTTLDRIERGAPVDLVFQSIAGTEAANKSFGINLELLGEAREAALSLKRGTVGDNVMYFETGQGSCLSADAHHGVDQQTLEARAYAVARAFCRCSSTPSSASSGRNICTTASRSSAPVWRTTSAASCSALPMGCDVCYTNHAEADQDDMDVLLTLLARPASITSWACRVPTTSC